MENPPAFSPKESRRNLTDFLQGRTKSLCPSRLTPEDYVQWLNWERKHRALPSLAEKIRGS